MISKSRTLLFGAMLLASTTIFAKERLVFAIDLVRHGARTPTTALPNEPYLWKEGPGQLTAEGIQQEIQLGRKLRHEYVDQYHLLSKQYDPTQIYVRSTRADRTIQSAEALLSGLYPLDHRPLTHQKIPIQTFVKEKDYLLVSRPGFHPWSLLKCYLANRKLWTKKTGKIQQKLNDWSAAVHLPLNNFYELAPLADNLTIRKAHHIPPPKGLNQDDVDEIIHIHEDATIQKYRLKEITQPMGQEFLKTVNDYFNLAKAHKTPLKYVLFSAHDSTIMSVMNTLGTPVTKIPPFASRLGFLLFEDDGRYYVRILYP